ncbi:MAG: signal peptidase I [Caulobacteraceae bacterium]
MSEIDRRAQADKSQAAAVGKPAGALRETAEIVKTVVYALLIAFVIRTLLFQPYTIPSASEEPNLFQGDYIIVSKWSYGYSRHSILFSPPVFNGRLFFTPPTRGDIIVFKLPHDGHTDFIKRLIGLPGDRVQMRDGHLLINGRLVPERPVGMITTHDHVNPDYPGAPEQVTELRETNPEGRNYLIQKHQGGSEADNTGVYVVPPHCYFMMGDNRDNSEDSRFDPGLAPEDPKLGGCGWDSRLDDRLTIDPQNPGVGFVPEENLVGKAQIVIISWNRGAALWKPWTWLDLNLSRFLRLLH